MNWRDIDNAVAQICSRTVPGDSLTLHTVIERFSRAGKSYCNDVLINFENGFESHLLYKVALEAARKRILVFGRKNRKLFDKEHGGALKNLKELILRDGLDFRVLFLDPDAPRAVLACAHST